MSIGSEWRNDVWGGWHCATIVSTDNLATIKFRLAVGYNKVISYEASENTVVLWGEVSLRHWLIDPVQQRRTFKEADPGAGELWTYITPA